MRQAERVEFNTIDGVTLRGDFFQADGEGRPIVVMTSGLALLKEFSTPFAKVFQEAGVSALTFDYRNWGSSDGSPRCHTSLLQQADDYRDAITGAMNLPGVNPKKTVLWGIGHGGAGAMIAAADDPRPKAVILQSPILSGKVDSQNWPKGIVEWAWRDREAKALAGDRTPTYIQAWPETLEEVHGDGDPILLKFEAAYGLLYGTMPRFEASGTPWKNKISLQSMLNVASVEPKDWLYKIHQPTLHIVTPSNAFTGTAEYAREAFSRLGPNGEFQVFTPPPEGGFDAFARAAIEPQLSFLNRVL